jgi:hypothetical protein
MGKRHLLAITVAATLVLTPSAVAQTTLDATVGVTPQEGGTPKRPQGHKLMVGTSVVVPGGQVQPMVTGFELWLGPRWESHSEGVPTCSPKSLSRRGPDACPPGSKLSTTGGNADVDDPEAPPKFQFFNAPGGQMLSYMALQRPARVRAAIPITVVDGARGPWPLRYAMTFPQSMQVVSGIPITFEELRFAFGYTKAAKNYIASTSCPKGGWAWRVRLHTWTATGGTAALTATDRAPCTATR